MTTTATTENKRTGRLLLLSLLALGSLLEGNIYIYIWDADGWWYSDGQSCGGKSRGREAVGVGGRGGGWVVVKHRVKTVEQKEEGLREEEPGSRGQG